MKTPIEKLGEEKVTKILQDRELTMLKAVKEVMYANGIEFFLACGTALGCIRHAGFIPWDDDIDIYVRGEDYDRIKKAFCEKSDSNLKFQDFTTVDGYPYTFPKIVDANTVLVEKSLSHLSYSCGVYIDIFPIYGSSDNPVIRWIEEAKRYFYYAQLKAFYFSFGSGMRGLISYFAKKLVRPQKVQRNLKKIYTSDRNNSMYLIEAGTFGKQARLKSKPFSTKVMMPFEGSMMPVCGDVDTYLNDYYGDYMKLPAEEERVARHHINILEIPGVKELEEE